MSSQGGNGTPTSGARGPARRRRRFGMFKLFILLLVIYGGLALTSPWAFHIGGRWTPLLNWTGVGKLVAKSGSYPIYIWLMPSSHFSSLHLDGLRPTGGVSGRGFLCVSPGTVIPLEVTGTIYGGWRSTDGSLMDIRVFEANSASQRLFDVSHRGYFDLFGYWHGQQLAMNDRGRYSSKFRSGLTVEHASVTFEWGSKSEFESACANTKSRATPNDGNDSATSNQAREMNASTVAESRTRLVRGNPAQPNQPVSGNLPCTPAF